jgi:hypothetical protein
MTKQLLSTVAVMTLVPAFCFAAGDMKAKNMTCNEFIGLDETVQPKVVYFIEGATKSGKIEDAMISVDEVSKPVMWVLEECKKTPKETVWKKVENWVKTHSRKM